MEIRPPTVTAPTLDVPDTVALGSDIIVKWSAGNGLDITDAPPGTWVGLYHSKSCTAYNVNMHKCHIAVRVIPANTTSGEVRFSQTEYKDAGDFDVRYFAGNTRHGQGVVCRGLKEIKETYLQCMLEPAAVSRVVFVDPEEPTALDSDMPGLEATFDGGEETFEMETSAFL